LRNSWLASSFTLNPIPVYNICVKPRLLALLLLPCLLAALLQPVTAQTPSPTLPFSPSALRALDDLAPDQKAAFIITLADQLASPASPGKLSPLETLSLAAPSKQARQQAVIESLQAHAAAAQATLLAQARSLQAAGQVDSILSFWIFNGISLRATPAAMRALAAMPGIARITPDPDPDAPIVLLDEQNPGFSKKPGFFPASSPEPNVSLVNAPALWDLGYTGQGVVIASLDTGVDYTHPDLAASYRGGADSWFDPYAQNAAPADFNGHGTMTMGLMVGASAGGTAIGIAPGAKWISAKIFDNSTHYTDAAVHQALQWVINPNNNPADPQAPDVVNNSWGYSNAGHCDVTFQPDLLAVEAAGIIPVFSSGNVGPGIPSDVSPANNAGAFPVAAIDNNSLIASFSSRGPNSCDPGSPYPEVSAPGVVVRAAAANSDLYTTCTGTSCAAPAVTGGIALLLSAIPHLSTTLQESAITSGAADLGSAGFDTTYGYGRLDLLASYNWLTGPQGLLVIPALLTAAPASSTEVDLSWRDNNLANATGYEVERSLAGLTAWTTLTTTPQDAVSYSDTTTSEGTLYEYRVRAVNSTLSTSSPYAYVQAVTPLLAPTGLSATAVSATQIDLAWTNVSAVATGMDIQRSPDGLTGWSTLAANVPGTTYSDATVPAEGTPWFYRIQAVDPALGAAAGSPYATADATSLLYTPNLYASPIDQTEIDLYWYNFSALAGGYELQRSPDGLTGWTTIASGPLTLTRFADAPLTPVSVYYYRLRVTGTPADSPYSIVRRITTSPYIYYAPLAFK